MDQSWRCNDWGRGAGEEVGECADGCGDQIFAAAGITKSVGLKWGGADRTGVKAVGLGCTICFDVRGPINDAGD